MADVAYVRYIVIDSDGYIEFLGAGNTDIDQDGNWKIEIDGDGNLSFYYRYLSVWKRKGRFSK